MRKQDEWINSMCNQILKYPHLAFLGLNEFIGYKKNKFEENKEYLDILNANWCKIIELVENKFGKENLFVLPYELFKENFDEFLGRFYEYFNIEPFYPQINDRTNFSRKSFDSSLYSKYLYYRHKLPPNLQKFFEKNDKGFLKWSQKIKINVKIKELSKKQSKQIMEIHRENNKKLAEIIEMDLSKYGYY